MVSRFLANAPDAGDTFGPLQAASTTDRAGDLSGAPYALMNR